MPIYFTLSIYRVLLSGGVRANTQKPTPKGAPFYNVWKSGQKLHVRQWEMSSNATTMPLVVVARNANARGGTVSPGRRRSGFTGRNLLYWPKVMTPKVPLP